MSHGGGGGVRKVPKKCHVLFEWPLITYSFVVAVIRYNRENYSSNATIWDVNFDLSLCFVFKTTNSLKS